jgi:hypothetical protein
VSNWKRPGINSIKHIPQLYTLSDTHSKQPSVSHTHALSLHTLCVFAQQIILWDSIDELQKESLGNNGRGSNGKSNGFDPEQTALQLLSAHKRAVKVLKLCDTAILHISTLHPSGSSSSGEVCERFYSGFKIMHEKQWGFARWCMKPAANFSQIHRFSLLFKQVTL